jgi:hypothetical protein
VSFLRTDTVGLLNALDAARTWAVRRFAVASSLGVYIGRTKVPWHEELALPAAELPHLIIAFKKAVEPLTTHSLQSSGVQPVVLRIGSTWGSIMDPESPFNGVGRITWVRRSAHVDRMQPVAERHPQAVVRVVHWHAHRREGLVQSCGQVAGCIPSRRSALRRAAARKMYVAASIRSPGTVRVSDPDSNPAAPSTRQDPGRMSSIGTPASRSANLTSSTSGSGLTPWIVDAPRATAATASALTDAPMLGPCWPLPVRCRALGRTATGAAADPRRPSSRPGLPR